MGNETETPLEEIREETDEEMKETFSDNFQDKYERLRGIIMKEQRRCNQLHAEFESCQRRELSLQNELAQLRKHLENIHDSYKVESLKTDEHTKFLELKLQEVAAMNLSSSSMYRLASISEAQQMQALRERAWLIAQQREDVQGEKVAAENEIAKQVTVLKNLKCVWEELKNYEKLVGNSRRYEVCDNFEAALQKHNELLGEITSLKSQLQEAKEGLNAVSRMAMDLEVG